MNIGLTDKVQKLRDWLELDTEIETGVDEMAALRHIASKRRFVPGDKAQLLGRIVDTSKIVNSIKDG